jgi:hypothetical protein
LRRDRTPGGEPRRVATPYVIDRDGTVYELFDPAFHLGLPWPYRQRVVGAVGVGSVVGRVTR